VVLICVIVAQIAIFSTHNNAVPPIADFYSLHSWIGILTIALFFAQWIAGLLVYFYSFVGTPTKAWIMPYHVYIGHLIFVLGLAAAISGINEKAVWKLSKTYFEKGAEAMLMNFIGVVIAIFGALVVYLTSNVYYKRYPRPEDGVLLERS